MVLNTHDFAVQVQTDAGKKWWVCFSAQIDCGSLYDLNGDRRWRHESDPAVLDYLEMELKEHLEHKRDQGQDLSRLIWKLERNGRRPL